MLDPMGSKYSLVGFDLEKCDPPPPSEKRQFLQADMAVLGKYCTGGYGGIGLLILFPSPIL